MTPYAGDNGHVDGTRRVFAFTNTLLRYRWLLIIVPILAGGVSLVRSLTTPRTWTARTTFMSQSGGTAARVSNNALAQFGISLGAPSDPTLTPDFYVELLRSRPVLQRTVNDTFTVASAQGERRTTLIQHWGGEDRAIDRLAGAISPSIAPKTGVVTVTTRAETPALAQQIANALIRQLDDFNRARRKSRVGAERQFTEARLAESAAELRQAENALQDFYTRNRDFDRSPELRFREERLTREVARRQLMYSTLSQAFEQAKIDEVRDTPVITVIEEPALPRVPDSRHTVDRALLAMVVALLLSVALALGIDAMKRARVTESEELVELRSLSRTFASEVRNPLRTARRLFS